MEILVFISERSECRVSMGATQWCKLQQKLSVSKVLQIDGLMPEPCSQRVSLLLVKLSFGENISE